MISDDDSTPRDGTIWTGPTAATACLQPELSQARLPAVMVQYVPALQAAANAYQLDPFLLAAIMWRETRAGQAPGLEPAGPAGLGDDGHGHGLMQIDDRSHAQFCGLLLSDGTYAWTHADLNIMEGARILRVEGFDVLEQDMPAAVCSYNAGAGAARRALSTLPPGASYAQRVAALDSVTTGHNYVSDVLATRQDYLNSVPA